MAALHAAAERLEKAQTFRELAEGRQEGQDLDPLVRRPLKGD